LPPPAAAGELDLLERPQTPTKVTLKGRSVSAPIPPHGIVTLLLDIPQRKPA
jgi:hypothetical protein